MLKLLFSVFYQCFRCIFRPASEDAWQLVNLSGALQAISVMTFGKFAQRVEINSERAFSYLHRNFWRSPVRLVRQLSFWHFSVNYLTAICWFFPRIFLNLSSWKRKQTSYWSKAGFFFSVCHLNNRQIIDWKMSET